jgi:hypothetical protein
MSGRTSKVATSDTAWLVRLLALSESPSKPSCKFLSQVPSQQGQGPRW